MFRDEIQAVGNAAANKYRLLRDKKIAFFISAMLAGAFIGFGSLLMGAVGGYFMADYPGVNKLLGALVFTTALSMVVMCGGELFTGNNFVMTAGAVQKKVRIRDLAAVWIVGYIGNFAGALLLCAVYKGSGAASEPIQGAFASMAAAKMSLLPGQMLFRGILCNVLVCLAVWCSIKLKSEGGKLCMIVMCIFAFIMLGFEHSVANMTTLTMGMMYGSDPAINGAGYALNLVFVTIGNIIGGMVVAGAYLAIGSDRNR